MNTLNWIVSRLKNKYKESPDIIQLLQNIIKNNKIIDKNRLNDTYIDNILSQHFPDYKLDKCEEFTFGFTEEQRDVHRTIAREIVEGLVL